MPDLDTAALFAFAAVLTLAALLAITRKPVERRGQEMLAGAVIPPPLDGPPLTPPVASGRCPTEPGEA